MIKNTHSKIRKAYNLIKFWLIEKTFEKRLKYLFFGKNNDTILICFSAFPRGKFRVYNYVKGFADTNIDRLYINDTFGYKGSYYLFENGSEEPFKLTCALIQKYICSGKYRHIYTAGTSKGGSCAIIFGLLFKAEKIFSGACQYHLGTYLNVPTRYRIFEGMMGKNASKKEEAVLNDFMPSIIMNNKDSQSVVYLLYSKQEHTYEEDVKDLIDDLNKNNIPIVEQEEFFRDHNSVGGYFIPFVKSVIG